MQMRVKLAVHPSAPLLGLLELRVTLRPSVVSPPMFLDGTVGQRAEMTFSWSI